MLIFTAFAQRAIEYVNYSFPDVRANDVIKGIAKDSLGYVWLVTDLGVISYNGSKTITHSSGLGSLYTKKVTSLQGNQLIVVTDAGIQSIETVNDSVRFNRFEYFGIDLSFGLNYPKSVFQDKSKTLWIGESDAISRVSKEGHSRFDFGNNFSYHRSFSFTEDAFGNVWTSSFNGQLMVYNPKFDKFDSISINSEIKNFTSIVTVKGDFILTGGDKGMLMLKVDSDREILESNFFNNIENISTLKVVGNLVFIGTWNNGLFYFDYTEDIPRFEQVESLGFNDVVDLFYDKKDDEIWIAGSERIAMLKKPVFSKLGVTGKYRIESFDYDSKGDLYFTTGEKIFVHRKGADQKSQLIASENNFYTSLSITDDLLWVGDHLGKVTNYDLKSDGLSRLELIGQVMLPVNHINTIKNEVWIASSGHGIVRFDSNGGASYFDLNQMNVIKESPTGDIYSGGTGSANLLYKYDDQKFNRIDLKIMYDLPGNIRVEDIGFDDQGKVYLASSEGVLIVESDSSQDYVSKEKLNFSEGQPVYSCRAIENINGNLWIATNEGLFQYSDQGSVQFNTINGLPSRLVKQRGLHYDNDQLTIGTAQGLAHVNPNKLNIKKTPPPIVDRVLINEAVASSPSQMGNIPFHSNLEVSFQCLSFPSSEIQYQFRVRGLNENWSNPSENRVVSLLAMSQGTYSIEVRAKSVGNYWSDSTAINYQVLNPWYLSWWAYLSLFFLIVTIWTAANKIYNYNLINQKEKLKKLVSQGTAEIEKHKNEIIEQQEHIIHQKEELIEKNETVFKTKEALTDADLKYLQLKEYQLKDQVEYKNKQITTHTLNIIQKNETLLQLKGKLEKVVKDADKATNAEVKKTIKFIEDSFKQDKDWEDFKLYFEQIYTGFYTKLKTKCPVLTGHELRHCALIRLNLSIQECASIMGISPESVKVSRARIRKKIQTDAGKGLSEFILSL